MTRKFLYFYIFLFFILFIFGGFFVGNRKLNKINIVSEPTPIAQQINENIILAKVIRVVDGDTIKVLINNKESTVRLIGIDAPEIVSPKMPAQCFGKEASDKAKEILSNKTVILESDPTQGDKDKYRRFLRYIFLDGLNFNKLMISEGYVHEYTYQNNHYKYIEEFKNAQKQARENKKGFWADGVCSF